MEMLWKIETKGISKSDWWEKCLRPWNEEKKYILYYVGWQKY